MPGSFWNACCASAAAAHDDMTVLVARIWKNRSKTKDAREVRAFMEQYHMVTAGERVLLGLSGGADSVCLFHLLRELQEPLGFSLLAVHVNHNLRGAEAGRDAAFAENLCREYDVPFYLYSCPVEKIAKEKHLSTEEAGRAARQEVFAACAKEQRAVKIALAHHQDDVAETMLHHLARGTSLAGLAPYAPCGGM